MTKRTVTTQADEKLLGQVRNALIFLNKAKRRKKVRLLLVEETTQQNTALPEPIVELMVNVLDEIACGNDVTIVGLRREFTTQQAADILNVSRPYLIRLLETGRIPFRKVGTKRRILQSDVLLYKQIEEAKGKRALDELAAEAQKLGLGY